MVTYRDQNILDFALGPGKAMRNKMRPCHQGAHNEYVLLIYLGVRSFGIHCGHKVSLVQ